MNFFKNAVEFAHFLWKNSLTKEDLAVDLTAGNGRDVGFLAELGLKRIIAVDIQEKAILRAKKNNPNEQIEFIVADHAQFPEMLQDNSVRLAIYNLGYLPGGDKKITTMSENTLLSIKKMMSKLSLEGSFSITCYPGHIEGAIEESSLLAWSQTLSPKEWIVTHTRWSNRNNGPSLLWIRKCQPLSDSKAKDDPLRASHDAAPLL